MSEFANLNALTSGLKVCATISPDGLLTVTDKESFRGTLLDSLAWTSVFGADEPTRDAARWIIRAAAPAFGVVSASIQDLYTAFAAEKLSGFTVPAINLRMMVYESARAVARTAIKNNTGAFIYELANSEMGYTDQTTFEYAAVVTAAAIREGLEGPLFIQGDHYQFKMKSFKAERDKEIDRIKDLTRSAIAAGYLNIDIDASTLVDLDRTTVSDQQRDNFEMTAELTKLIRELEPEGTTISVGGEIGEVGAKNSTVEELRAYVDGYLKLLNGQTPCSKISVQTGSTHGGVPRPDGSVADVKIEFETLEKLSEAARGYGMGGAVQHGASTLPDELFNNFPKRRTLEIHLATGFQNMVYDHALFPKELRREMYARIEKKHANERKEGWTDEQFRYKVRKKSIGPFKREVWSLPRATQTAICEDLEKKFDFLFKQLNVPNTRDAVTKHVTPSVETVTAPESLRSAACA